MVRERLLLEPGSGGVCVSTLNKSIVDIPLVAEFVVVVLMGVGSSAE